jgi:hypothetical protein
MAVTLHDLLTGTTRDALLRRAIAFLRLQRFPVVGWQPGNPWRTLVELVVELTGDVLRAVELLGAGGFLDYAEGPLTPEGEGWLDLLLRNLFDMERKPATFAVHAIAMRDAAGVGPVPVQAGQVVALGPGGLEFVALENATVPLNGEVSVRFQARSPGALYNVPVGAIAALGTDLPGVQVFNAAVGTTGTSLLSAGLDRETPAEARVRAKARWARLGTGATRAAYLSALLDAANDIRRVAVLENTPSAGKVTAFVAAPAGPAPQAALDAAKAAVERMRPLAIQVFVRNTATQPVAVVGVVTCAPGQAARVEADSTARLLAYQATLPLGAPVVLAQLVEEIMRPDGALNVTLLQPPTDVTPASGYVLVLELRLAFVEGTA